MKNFKVIYMKNTTKILMPKATAVWLIHNTSLTFDQIAEFCALHPLEVKGIADGEVAVGIRGEDPTLNGQLSSEEIKRCESDQKASLRFITKSSMQLLESSKKKRGAKYIPVAMRNQKPDAVAWLVKNYPSITDIQIVKLIGTTKSTIKAVKERTHWNSPNIRPRDPVLLGLCKQVELDVVIKSVTHSENKSKNEAHDLDQE